MTLRDYAILPFLWVFWVLAEALCAIMTLIKHLQGAGGRVYVTWEP